MFGNIHSIETMGLMDGPGIRFVIFFQGCRLRCAYCHNPDTWSITGGKSLTPKTLLKNALRYKPYFESSAGGITCSGGEPLLQPGFLIEFLRLCKANGLHTTLDTSGFGKGYYEEILKYTDLVLLDIKHIDRAGYKELTGGNMNELYGFIETLNQSGKNVWIRHVTIPGITDDEEHIKKLKSIIKTVNNIKKIELLPYHTLGVKKYEVMGIRYRLTGVEPTCKEKIKELEKLLV